MTRHPERSAPSRGSQRAMGKSRILEELATELQVSPDRTIYVGDGSSDLHVMLHVNSGDGRDDCGYRKPSTSPESRNEPSSAITP